jgi:FKBP-type peptidyl-prolyl cis-trans isomerase
MRHRIILVVLTAVISSFFILSCNDRDDELQKEKELRLLKQYLELKSISVEPVSSGLYFIPTFEGTGAKPQQQHWVIIRYTGRLVNDRMFDTTEENKARNNNIYSSSIMYGDKRLPIASLPVKGVQEGLMLMNEGSRATLIIPSHLAFGKEGAGIVPSYSTLVYDIELVKVISNPELYEKEMIDDYIAQYNDSTHLVVEKKVSGLYYIEILEGTGENTPQPANRVSVYYEGRLTDGRVFDTNMGGTVMSFDIGALQMIEGFEEAVKLMKTEGRSRVVIPSSIGYGPLGSGTKIVGFTPLVFDLVLTAIETNN